MVTNQNNGGSIKTLPFGMDLFIKLVHFYEADITRAKESCVEMIIETQKQPWAAEEILSYYHLEADWVLDLYALCERWEVDITFRHRLTKGTSYEGSDINSDDYFVDPYHDEQD